MIFASEDVSEKLLATIPVPETSSTGTMSVHRRIARGARLVSDSRVNYPDSGRQLVYRESWSDWILEQFYSAQLPLNDRQGMMRRVLNGPKSCLTRDAYIENPEPAKRFSLGYPELLRFFSLPKNSGATVKG